MLGGKEKKPHLSKQSSNTPEIPLALGELNMSIGIRKNTCKLHEIEYPRWTLTWGKKGKSIVIVASACHTITLDFVQSYVSVHLESLFHG